ncbi:MAG: hypothetical protein P9X24_00410 [Candidatus Hatepunaea meridiana]|nr:hypothetical protein [Candidatus Hatepunaea meridiana]
MNLNKQIIKDIFKEALIEVMEDRKHLFQEAFIEALEDIGMLKAIQESDDELIDEDEFMSNLRVRISELARSSASAV